MKLIKQEAWTQDGVLANVGWHTSQASCAEERKRLRPLFRKLEFKQHDVIVEPNKAGIIKALNDHASRNIVGS